MGQLQPVHQPPGGARRDGATQFPFRPRRRLHGPLGVNAQQLDVVVEHFLEARHRPPAVHRVPGKATLSWSYNADPAMASSVRAANPAASSADSERTLRHAGAGSAARPTAGIWARRRNRRRLRLPAQDKTSTASSRTAWRSAPTASERAAVPAPLRRRTATGYRRRAAVGRRPTPRRGHRGAAVRFPSRPTPAPPTLRWSRRPRAARPGLTHSLQGPDGRRGGPAAAGAGSRCRRKRPGRRAARKPIGQPPCPADRWVADM